MNTLTYYCALRSLFFHSTMCTFFLFIFSEKSINTMLDCASTVSEMPFDKIEAWYEVTKRTALARNTERLYTNMRISGFHGMNGTD